MRIKILQKEPCLGSATLALAYCLVIVDKELRDTFAELFSYFFQLVLPGLIGAAIMGCLTNQKIKAKFKKYLKNHMPFIGNAGLFLILNHICGAILGFLFIKLSSHLFKINEISSFCCMFFFISYYVFVCHLEN